MENAGTKRMRHSVRAFMAAALFAVVAAVLFVLSAKRPPGDTVGMSLAVAAAVASTSSAFGFLVQWRDGAPVTVQGTVKTASL
jgi:hypothetical protein